MDKIFYTMDDFDFSGKTVLLRVDFNSPVDPSTGKISDESRIMAHIPTFKELVKKGAKIVVLAHQGRKGDPDFISLEQHSKILSRLLGKPVGFVDDVYGEKAMNAIKKLKKSEILVLQNVRFTPDEKAKVPPEKLAETNFVRSLSKVADYYINDAFSAAHRADASLIAFDQVLPAIAGRLMELELKNLDKVSNHPEKPSVYVLGGTKVEDTFTIVKYVLEKNIASKVLTSGLVANTYLLSEGYELGKVNDSLIEQKGHLTYLSPIKEILDKFRDKIELPVDLAYDNGGKRVEIDLDRLPVEKPIKDIGTKTIENYSKIIQDAKTIVCNGPPGIFEEENFAVGTRKIFEAIVESKAFSLVGGGHTTAALNKFGLQKKVSYATVAGGAFITYLSGEKLPAIEALEKAYKKGSK
jgi:phosphoglycerate kinase